MNKQWNLVRKNLSVAATGLALVSWYTTANGLHDFVFNNWWQAAIISGAIQITLFVLNLKLAAYISKNKWGVLPLWAICLFASSTFSYVYISSAIYKDSLYYSDADRIMQENISELTLQVDEHIENNVAYYKNYAEIYCSAFVDIKFEGDNSTSDINKLLDAYIKTLENSKLYVDNDTTATWAVQTLRAVINDNNAVYTDEEISSLLITFESVKSSFDYLHTITKEDHDHKKDMWDKNSERLKQYSDFQDAEFKALQEQNNELKKDIEILSEKLTNINNIILDPETYTKNLYTQSNNAINKIESVRKNLLLEMNKDKPDETTIKNCLNTIYDAIIQQNSSEGSIEINNYYTFKNTVLQYLKFLELQTDINMIMDSLKNSHLTGQDNKLINDWKNDWYKILNNLRDVIQSCPTSDILTLEGSSTNESENIWLKDNTLPSANNFKREKMLTYISEIERKYLSDMNAIERSLNLLISKYKYMAWFSLISAILLDLTGTLIGIFLYYNNAKINRSDSSQRDDTRASSLNGTAEPSLS